MVEKFQLTQQALGNRHPEKCRVERETGTRVEQPGSTSSLQQDFDGTLELEENAQIWYHDEVFILLRC